MNIGMCAPLVLRAAQLLRSPEQRNGVRYVVTRYCRDLIGNHTFDVTRSKNKAGGGLFGMLYPFVTPTIHHSNSSNNVLMPTSVCRWRYLARQNVAATQQQTAVVCAAVAQVNTAATVWTVVTTIAVAQQAIAVAQAIAAAIRIAVTTRAIATVMIVIAIWAAVTVAIAIASQEVDRHAVVIVNEDLIEAQRQALARCHAYRNNLFDRVTQVACALFVGIAIIAFYIAFAYLLNNTTQRYRR